MKNIRKKLLCYVLTAVMLLTAWTPAYASSQARDSLPEEEPTQDTQPDNDSRDSLSLDCQLLLTQEDDTHQSVILEMGDSSTVMEKAVLSYQDGDGEIHTAEAEEIVENYAAFLLDLPGEGVTRTFLSIVTTVGGQDIETGLQPEEEMNTLSIDEEQAAEIIGDTAKQTDTESLSEEELDYVNQTVVTKEGEDGLTASDISEVLQSEAAPASMSRSALSAPKADTKAGTFTVVLDPGHGGKDGGAEYTFSDGTKFVESQLTLKIANYVKEALAAYPEIQVYMTRTGDTYLPDLGERVAIGVEKNADIFVSLHINSADSEKAHGVEILVPTTGRYNHDVAVDANQLATNILDNLVALGLYNRGLKYKDSASGTKYPDGSLADYYGIIRNCMEQGLPGVIVEHAFICGAEDKKFLDSEEDLKKLGQADAKGIAQYFNLESTSHPNKNLTKWKYINGKWYYYKDGKKLTGWQYLGSKWYYLNSSGVMQTGWQFISGKWYYLESSGAMAEGWKKLGNTWYYLTPGNGAMVDGWQKIGSEWYYFNGSGAMQTGWLLLDGKWYYLYSSGARAKGWITLGKTRYYLNPETGVMAVNWNLIDGKWYYFNASGAALTGWQKIGGKWYYLNSSGAMAEGWLKLGKTWYYLTPGNGAMKTGWYLVGNTWYYSDSSGAMLTGWQKIGGKWYYLNSSGAMAEGWLKLGKTWYYLTPGNGAMKTGWYLVGNTWYYSDSSGAMLTGWQKIGGKWYYMNSSGAMLTGWQKIGGKSYFFDNSGVWIEHPAQGWQLENGNWYYIGANGYHTGWLLNGGKWYYMDSTGKMLTGWQTVGGKTYYLLSSGAMVSGCYYTVDGVTYTFTQSGESLGNIDEYPGYKIMGTSSVTADQMVKYFATSKQAYPAEVLAKGGAPDIKTFCQIFLEECQTEGVKAEVAFTQAMKETGWLQYGGDVKIEQFNFAGLGATGGGVPGLSFADVRTGIRAQVQHLKAYASRDNLVQTCVDPRFTYVTRYSSPFVEWLGIPDNPFGGGWAAGKNYGSSLIGMITTLKSM